MNRKAAIGVFLLLMGSAGVIYGVIRAGWYPVAVVNSELVSTRLFQRELDAAFSYYTKTILKDGNLPTNSEDLLRELRRAVLDDLIEKKIIRQLARQEVGDRLPALVEDKIGFLDGNGNKVPEAVQSLYGMTLEEFRELVMIPEAERVILKDWLFADQKEGEFTHYLDEQRKKASVYVFSDLLTWRDGKIQSK